MPATALVIIMGRPCTGKTTLGRRLARDFRLPFICRDEIKEILFDQLGWSDRAWSRRLGMASWELLYLFLERELAAGRSCIAETNFSPQYDAPRLRNLTRRYGFEPFQICCHTDGTVLFERFRRRSESGERHPGHVDHLNYEELAPVLLKDGYDLLDIGGHTYIVDTTDFARIDYMALRDAICGVIA